MGQDDRELRKAIERLETRETAIQHEIELAGSPTHRQKRILDDLTRLQHSLRGPEEVLDKHGYSRPFPPKASSHQKEGGTTEPFQREAQAST